MTKTLPRIRFVEAHPAEHEGQPIFVLKDPSGYSDNVVVTPEALFIIQRLNGQSTMVDIQADFQKAYGEILMSDDVNGLVDSLDQAMLLDTPRFAEYCKEQDEIFFNAPVRPFLSVPDDPTAAKELRLHLDECFEKAGYPPGNKIQSQKTGLSGLIAPHIDYLRGGKVYGSAYGKFFSEFDGDTVIILGTNHQGLGAPAIFTTKDFDSPFGVVKTDADSLCAIAEKLPFDPYEFEIEHRNEHSIELAATMLAYGDLCDKVKILPILISGLYEFVENGASPFENPAYAAIINALQDLVREKPGNAAVIASADLAHIGPQFGDPDPVDEIISEGCKQKDLESLDIASQGDARGFYNYIAEEKDQRKVCGLAPISIALAALAPATGQILDYDQWVSEEGHGSVSFAAMSIETKGK